jgi:hypothetical protein
MTFKFKVEIPSVGSATIANTDLQTTQDLIFRKLSPNSKNYYQYDPNNSGTFTVSDFI